MLETPVGKQHFTALVHWKCSTWCRKDVWRGFMQN